MEPDDSLLDGDVLRRCRGHLAAGGFLRMRLLLLIDAACASCHAIMHDTCEHTRHYQVHVYQ